MNPESRSITLMPNLFNLFEELLTEVLSVFYVNNINSNSARMPFGLEIAPCLFSNKKIKLYFSRISRMLGSRDLNIINEPIYRYLSKNWPRKLLELPITARKCRYVKVSVKTP